MDAGGSGVQGCVGEINGGADPDPGPFGVGVGSREAFDEFRGRFDAGQFPEPGEPPEAGERHDPGNDRDGHPGPACPGQEVSVLLGVEEDLGDGEVGTGALFGQQDLDVVRLARGFRVPGRVGGDADRDPAGAQQRRTALLHAADEFDQVLGVPERSRRRGSSILGPVAAEGEDAADADVEQFADDLRQFLRGIPHTGQVGQGPQRRFLHEPVDEIDGGAAVGAVGAVGHGHVVRVCGFQFADGGPKGFRGCGRPRREQLVGQRNGSRAGQIGMGVDKAWW